MPTKNAEKVLSINIYSGSLTLPSAIIFKLTMIVLMQLMDGPNLNIFLAIAAAVMSDSALPFLFEITARCEIITSYCSVYLVTR